jgi:flagellar biosynthesis protein FlhF
MNVHRFTARTSRDALQLVRQALGEDAVVLSTKPCPEGVEVMALGPQGLQQLARQHVTARHQETPAAPAAVAPPETSVQEDVAQLQMSTLTFQDYVRQRMQKRLAVDARAAHPASEPMPAAVSANVLRRRVTRPLVAAQPAQAVRVVASPPPHREVPVLREEITMAPPAWDAPAHLGSLPSQADLLNEMRAMKSLIEDRFGALAFMEKLQRHPRAAQLTQRLMDSGFSPHMVRHLVDGLPAEAPDDMAWASAVLERNLLTSESERKSPQAGGGGQHGRQPRHLRAGGAHWRGQDHQHRQDCRSLCRAPWRRAIGADHVGCLPHGRA